MCIEERRPARKEAEGEERAGRDKIDARSRLA